MMKEMATTLKGEFMCIDDKAEGLFVGEPAQYVSKGSDECLLQNRTYLDQDVHTFGIVASVYTPALLTLWLVLEKHNKEEIRACTLLIS